MVWDLVVAYVGITFAVAGWNIGLVNSWPAPFAAIFATIACQFIYPDLSAWLIQEMELPAAAAVFLGYCVVWLACECVAEMVLLLVVPLSKKYGVKRWERACGAVIGFAKGAVLLVFASLASMCAFDFPAPPHYPIVSLWVYESSQDSRFLQGCKSIALNMPVNIAEAVVSPTGASFQPDFRKRALVQTDERKTEQFRSFFEAIKQLELEAQQF